MLPQNRSRVSNIRKQGVGTAYSLQKVFGVGLIEMVIFRQRLEAGVRRNHVGVWGRAWMTAAASAEWMASAKRSSRKCLLSKREVEASRLNEGGLMVDDVRETEMGHGASWAFSGFGLFTLSDMEATGGSLTEEWYVPGLTAELRIDWGGSHRGKDQLGGWKKRRW